MAGPFTVKRVTADPNGQIVATCELHQTGYKYEILDTSTGVITVENVCINNDVTDPCTALSILAGRGYTPNDWSTECP